MDRKKFKRIIAREGMRKKQLIIIGISAILLLNGCFRGLRRPYYEQKLAERELESIRTDLNGMTDSDIESYFNKCIANNKIFIYIGGYDNTPLVDKKDWDFVKPFKQVSVGCTGGVPQASKFNRLMLNYLRAKK